MSHGLISHSNGSELLIRRETCRARRLRTCLRYHFHVTEQAEPPCVNQEAHEVKNEQPGSSQAAVCLPDGGTPRPPTTRTGGYGHKTRPPHPAPCSASTRRRKRAFQLETDPTLLANWAWTETAPSPAGTAVRRSLLGAAPVRQDLEHVGEGAAVGGLGDEDAQAAEEGEEGDADADGGDGVAAHEAHVLLDVGHAAQREEGPQVDAPVEPVEEPARGFRAAVFNLQATGTGVRLGGRLQEEKHTQWGFLLFVF